MSDGPSILDRSGINVEISIESELWSGLGDVAELAEPAIAETIRQSRPTIIPGVEVSILLCDDAFIRALNRQWRGIDAPTNVLSFPARRGPTLGDIAIAYETTAREAAAEGKTVKAHFVHLLVHGFLHLVGYDHQTDAQADGMERLERSILAALGIADPYGTTLVGISE
jgi:probable rRNA maturation factor